MTRNPAERPLTYERHWNRGKEDHRHGQEPHHQSPTQLWVDAIVGAGRWGWPRCSRPSSTPPARSSSTPRVPGGTPFDPHEIAEAFAATGSVTIPLQLHRLVAAGAALASCSDPPHREAARSRSAADV